MTHAERPFSRLKLHCTLLLAALFLFITMPAAFAHAQDKVIIAYVFPRDRVLSPDEINARKLTRINYAFANIKDGEIVEGFPHDAENLAILNALKRDNPALRILVSVGGWTWSGNFSDAALTRQSRTRFIASAVRFLERYHLDGLDIDWEYPNQIGNGNTFRPEDKHNFTLLLAELRQRFDAEQKRLGRRLYTSIATGASQKFLDNTEMAKVQHYVDTINLMTYDFYVGGPTTGHDAPLFHNPADPKNVSADHSLDLYLQAEVSEKKIVLGLPFYGRSWGEVPNINNGLFQPGKAARGVHFSYPDLPNLLATGFARYWDQTASVPFLYNPSTQVFVTYEDPQSIARKCRYVRERHLAGVMFWEYSNDSTGILLDALHAGLQPPPDSNSGAD
ncbi:glycoside hydrolase family 18 protein [Edaphobacter aggregans]|uniref:glycoside hydrolase family 18 protein n=1 Tax=Edaphobacter aggregans TaxID=570835 RepID=UPI00068F9942|nr:glycoside hydrolase family 18 protein [Edaphobacter aggregans]